MWIGTAIRLSITVQVPVMHMGLKKFDYALMNRRLDAFTVKVHRYRSHVMAVSPL